MSITHAADIVSVWTEQARPKRLVWRGTRYLVTDTPTPLQGPPVTHEALTHPLHPLAGWRFQGTSVSDDADVRVFDVLRRADGRWELVAAYS